MPFTNPDTHRMGGHARKKALTAERRRQIARDGGRARWAIHRALKRKKTRLTTK